MCQDGDFLHGQRFQAYGHAPLSRSGTRSIQANMTTIRQKTTLGWKSLEFGGRIL
jgi:hypothetical protein